MADLNIRDIPDDLLGKLKVQAAIERATLKSCVLAALEQYLAKPNRLDSLVNRIAPSKASKELTYDPME